MYPLGRWPIAVTAALAALIFGGIGLTQLRKLSPRSDVFPFFAFPGPRQELRLFVKDDTEEGIVDLMSDGWHRNGKVSETG
jgi:hypothetical protein